MASSLNPSLDRRLAANAAAELAGGLLLLLLAAALVTATLELTVGFTLRALALYLLMAVLIWHWLPLHQPLPRLGPANRITLIRLLLTALAAGAVGAPRLTAEHGWLLSALALLALVLDGVDGWLARTRRCASAFGARFDMETDALFILLLALLVWQRGTAGAWIVLAGVWRYLFVAAGALLPRLRAPLPPSRRRQTVCVIQIVALIACLSPPIGPFLGSMIAAGALLLLSASFVIDILWLYRHGRNA